MANNDKFYDLTFVQQSAETDGSVLQSAEIYNLNPPTPSVEEVNTIRQLVNPNTISGMPFRKFEATKP